MLHRFADCNKFQTQVAPARQPIFERPQRAATVATQLAVRAVMHAQDVAGLAPCGVSQHCSAIGCIRGASHSTGFSRQSPGSSVHSTVCIPSSRAVADYPRIPQSKRRTKIFRWSS